MQIALSNADLTFCRAHISQRVGGEPKPPSPARCAPSPSQKNTFNALVIHDSPSRKFHNAFPPLSPLAIRVGKISLMTLSLRNLKLVQRP